MEQINIGYSTKNIPIPGKREYRQQLMRSTEKFVRSIGSRALFCLYPNVTQENKETFGYKSTKFPGNIPELKEFEDGIFRISQKVQLKNIGNSLLEQIIQRRKRSEKVQNFDHPSR